jgi:hypothetical protein
MSQAEELGPGIRLVKPSYLRERKAPRTAKQQFVVGKLVENGRLGKTETLRSIMVQAGYSENTAVAPTKVTESRGFQELLAEAMPDDQLTEVHKSLLSSKRLDHMTFPLGPEGEDDPNFSGAQPNADVAKEYAERTTLTDQEIKQLIADTGGTVRRIVHGMTARHVYFWAPNDKARHDALKLAYDLKGLINKKGGGDEPPAGNTTYNTFIQNNHLDPNAPEARDVVDMTLDSLMAATQKKALPE